MNEVELKNKVEQLQEKYNNLFNLREVEQEKLLKLKKELNNILKAQEIAQEAATSVQKLVHRQIADIVNKCLQTVFGELYEFSIRFESKRGKTEAELVFKRAGKERENIGGGVMDIVGFALQLSSILLSRKIVRPFMGLDQPFSNVSEEKGYLERIPDMIITLAEEFGIQFVQVTHDDLLKIGKIIKIE